MGYKDIVKDLVGGGLNAYHQKAKETVSRIKEQNVSQTHKINALVNSFDDDYITKKEEGSVISLEHSKEGMVFIDEFEGNTLVNYCQEGGAELTLNGDIDVEGTFVTTTECVDGGKVDVLCEGNTLVNLLQEEGSFKNINNYVIHNVTNVVCSNGELKYTTNSATGVDGKIKIPKKDNTFYTVIYTTKTSVSSAYSTMRILTGNRTTVKTSEKSNNANYQTYKMIITPTDISSCDNFYLYYRGEGSGDIWFRDVMVLEGDYTNKPTPLYFEGMKSVGELEGNKIEVLSKTPNDIDDVTKYLTSSSGITVEKIDNYSFKASGNGAGTWQQIAIRHSILNNAKVGDKYTLFIEGATLKNQYTENVGFAFRNATKNIPMGDTVRINQNKPSTNYLLHLTIPQDYNGIDQLEYRMHINQNTAFKNEIQINNILLVKGHFDINKFVPQKVNKKEIQLTQPLRGLPNGVKDKFVKQGGKWYVERNCGSVTFDGSEDWIMGGETNNIVESLFYVKLQTRKPGTVGLCSTFKQIYGWEPGFGEGIFYGNDINIRINQTKLPTQDLNGFKAWLQANLTTLIYQLATPTYELITDPSLITYLDTTHISNNSAIPCNMKIKNTGYNAIIKPNTQYTVALDTNKAGTVGLNLGGAKVTTTNNVALVTTPATLVDDSLRVCGKDIKGKNVRLIEGNKSELVPAMFNGVLSCFEDKDNNVELKMVNGNLIDNDECWETIGSHGIVTKDGCDVVFDCNGSANAYGAKMARLMKLEPNTSYFFGAEWEIIRGVTDLTRPFLRIHMPNTASYFGSRAPSFSFTTDATGFIRVMLYIDTPSQHDIAVKFKQIKLSKISAPYAPHQSNSTQFQLQEPLRGVGDVKDRLVLVDGVPMIERNLTTRILNGSGYDGSFSVNYHSSSSDGCYNRFIFDCKEMKGYAKALVCDCLPILKDGQMHQENMQVRNDVNRPAFYVVLNSNKTDKSGANLNIWLSENPIKMVYELAEPTYEPISLELQEIILECYNNGTLFLDTIIPPTAGLRYAGEVAISSTVKHNATSIDYTTHEINENMIPYIMDMDYRVLLLSEEQPVAKMQVIKSERLIPMLKREISTGRYSKEEYITRLKKYQETGRITDTEYVELEEILNEH